MRRRFDDVAEHGEVWEQVQMLKDGADFAPQLFDPARIFVFRNIRIKMHVLKFDHAAIDALESVKTAQQSRLAAARRADDSQNGLRCNFKRDAAQDARAVGLLDQIPYTNHRAQGFLSVALCAALCLRGECRVRTLIAEGHRDSLRTAL